MARPVNADGERTRRRILECALELFAERGADAVSIRQLAAASDVSLAMVHHYFGDKDGLYAACVDAMYDELAPLRAELETALAAGGALSTDSEPSKRSEPPAKVPLGTASGHTRALVERAVRVGFRFARGHQRAVRLGLRQVVSRGELDASRQRRVQEPFLEQASQALAAGLGRSARALRLPIQSLVALTARYAASTDRELALVAGLSPPRTRKDSEAAEQAVEDHLVDVALALLTP
jgi:AcrR family transcriptional regulator